MKEFSTLLVVLMLTGCAGGTRFPTVSNFTPSDISRVGLYVDVGGTPFHVHLGALGMVRDFKKTYPFSWNLDERITLRFTERLEAEGFDVVDLQSAGFSYFELDNLIIAKDGMWVDHPDRSASLSKLRNDLGIQAVVIVKGERVVAKADISPTGTVIPRAWMSGSGLFSMQSMLFKNYYAVGAFGVSVFMLQPPANLSASGPLVSQDIYRSIELENFPNPADIQNVTREEFQPVFSAIDQYISDAADLTVCSFQLGTHVYKDVWNCLPGKYKAE
jgi:hypothetical protein